jgi:hypothetical protein
MPPFETLQQEREQGGLLADQLARRLCAQRLRGYGRRKGIVQNGAPERCAERCRTRGPGGR